ncbi:MAG TPA: DUF669 domain-containing protein [bacterium]|nr:DUF669 domain-containing protein [bacterium]
MSNTQEKQQVNDLLKSLNEGARPSTEIPDGEYDVIIKKANVHYSKNGVKQVRWIMEIISGEYECITLFKFNTIKTTKDFKNTIIQLHSDMRKCGLTLKDIDEVDDPMLFRPVIGLKMRVSVINVKGGRNVYFCKSLDDSSEGSE